MTCKVYLVPEDVIHHWKMQQRQMLADQPSETAVRQSDSKMDTILNNPKLDDYEKEKLHSQELNKYLAMREQKAPMPTHDWKSPVLSSMPKMYMSKAKGLISFLDGDDAISVDNLGRVSINNQLLDDSNITDLIHDAMRFRSTVKQRPIGWEQLGAYLRQKNVPKELIGNKTWFNEPAPLRKKIIPNKTIKALPKKKTEQKGGLKRTKWISV